jgi:hypothetical protein
MIYQWYGGAGGVTNPVPDATNDTLSVTNITASSNYFAVITNLYGRSTSSLALLTVIHPPVVTAPPASLTVPAGGPATFTVSATSGLPLSYQWLFQSNVIADATNGTLALPSVARANSGYYSVIVANPDGSVTSSNALLVVSGVAQRILPLTALGGGRYRISFQDFDNGPLFPWDAGNLEMETCADLGAADWITLPRPIVITNGVGQVEFLVTNTLPQQFYRIRMR